MLHILLPNSPLTENQWAHFLFLKGPSPRSYDPFTIGHNITFNLKAVNACKLFQHKSFSLSVHLAFSQSAKGKDFFISTKNQSKLYLLYNKMSKSHNLIEWKPRNQADCSQRIIFPKDQFWSTKAAQPSSQSAFQSIAYLVIARVHPRGSKSIHKLI